MMYLLLFIVLILIVYLVYLFRWWKVQTDFPRNCTISARLTSDDIHSGDIVLTTTRRKKWRYSWWTHIALVFVDADGSKKIAEFSQGGLQVSPIEMYVNLERRAIYGVRRLKKALTAEESARLTAAVYSHQNTVFNHRYVTIWILKQVLPCCFPVWWIKGEHCTSFVADCLERAHIISACDRHGISVADFTTDWLSDRYDSDALLIHVPCH